jgi:hypothetical protein
LYVSEEEIAYDAGSEESARVVSQRDVCFGSYTTALVNTGQTERSAQERRCLPVSFKRLEGSSVSNLSASRTIK